jgi:hypothetical protein
LDQIFFVDVHLNFALNNNGATMGQVKVIALSI